MAGGLVWPDRSSYAPFDTSKPGASRAGVARGFRRGGLYHLACDRGVSAPAHELAEALFHGTVFERMIGDYQHPPARIEHRGHLAEQRRETFHLAIHRDSKRLEGAGRRMGSPSPARSQSAFHNR